MTVVSNSIVKEAYFHLPISWSQFCEGIKSFLRARKNKYLQFIKPDNKLEQKFVALIYTSIENRTFFLNMAFDKSLLNIFLLGLSFMLVFTAFMTMGNIQQTIIVSLKREDPDFEGDGYISLAIIYAVFSICNWAAPSLISMVGPRIAICAGGFTFLLFIMNFLIPSTWLLYMASVIIGSGAAIVWTGQGNYLTLNSSLATITRNSGIFWAMLQMSMIIGNLFVFIKFKGLSTIDKDTRTSVIWTLSGVCLAGVIVMGLLRPSQKPEGAEDEGEELKMGPMETFVVAVKLFFTRRVLFLVVTYLYTGLVLSFYSGVYGSSVGFTRTMENSKELVGLSGILLGVGEVLGGAIFGIMGTKTSKWGRDPIVIAGFLVHIIAYFLIFLNLPSSAPLGPTDDTALITSIRELAVFCAFLVGLGDACFNTQIFSILGSVYADNSASAFAIFKFSQSVAAAVCFFYSTKFDLYLQLGILLVMAILGTTTFVVVEWGVKKEALLRAGGDNAN